MSLNPMPVQPTLHTPLMARLKWLMVLRVVLAILFIGISSWFQFKQTSPIQPSFYPAYGIVIITCLLTILYARLFKWVADARLFAYLQIFGDILLITATVYVTGGIESLLSFLYFLSIISASILLNRTGGFYAASASSIAYGLLVNLDFYKVLPTGYKTIMAGNVEYERGDILATVMLNIIGFFTVAFLTGYLAERTVKIEKELEEKKIDFKNLEEVYNQSIDAVFTDLMNEHGYSMNPLDEGPSYFRIDKVFKKKDGKELFLGFSVSPMKEGGHVIIFQDLTRLRDIEEQLKRGDRLKALGELAAGMAHEVRNPLASISGSAQVLKQSLSLSDEAQHLMDIITRETNRLNALITEFLLFAKPAVKMAKINLSDILNDTIGMFRNSPESKNIEIQVKLDDSLVINGDGGQLKQVFWNLFLNASHAMLDGGQLKIGGHCSHIKQPFDSNGAKVVVIDISDTGAGIPQDKIDKIFDPFFTTRDSGTGLGLAVKKGSNIL